MSEQLGEAVLVLRTDDSQLDRGIDRAHGKAKGIAGEFDSAAKKVTGSTRSVGAAASKMASEAQGAARAASGLGTAYKAVGAEAHLSSMAIRESLVVTRELARGDLKRLPGSLSLLAQNLNSSGMSAKSFAFELLKLTGILRVTRNAHLAEEATAAAVAAQGARIAAERAAANVVVADTELAVSRAVAAKARADTRSATTAAAKLAAVEAEDAALKRLAKSQLAVTAAATEAAAAETVLAQTEARAAAAAEASSARTVVGLGRVGVALSVTAVAAGLLAAAFKGFKNQTADDSSLKDYAASLGLTRKEMKRLEDATVTWGDVFSSTMDVLLERAGVTAEGVKSAWQVALEEIGRFGKFSIAILLSAFAALVRGVGSAFVNLGKLVVNSISGMVNAAIALIESMLNKAISAVNTMADGANAVIARLPEGVRNLLGLGGGFGHLGTVALGRVQGKFDLSNPLKDMKDQFIETFRDVNAGFDSIAERASRKARDRIKKQADEIIADRPDRKDRGHKERAKGLSDEEKAYRKALDAAQDYLEALGKETDTIGMSAVEQKRYEAAIAAAAARQAAAVAPTREQAQALRELADQIIDTEQTWELVTKSTSAAEFIKNTVEPLEFENSLLGKNAAAQRLSRAERELTIAGIERGSDAWNRYIAATQQAIANEEQLARQQKLLSFADDLSNTIADLVTGTKSLGEAFRDMARSIIADLIRMTIRMLIFRALSGLFGGGANFASAGPSTGGSFLGSSLTFSGGFATGGLIPAGSFGIVGEEGPEPVISTSRGTMVLPNSSLRNGSGGQPAVVEIRVVAGQLFEPVVKQISGEVSVRVVSEAAPEIAKSAASATVKTLSKKPLP